MKKLTEVEKIFHRMTRNRNMTDEQKAKLKKDLDKLFAGTKYATIQEAKLIIKRLK